jgi:geranylgeranyl pyrophosphate synthase
VKAVVHEDSSIEAFLRESKAWADRELDRWLPAVATPPRALNEAMRYAVFGGGKRLRPALVRLLCAHFGGDDASAALPAVAIECVHTYSLVHDDLPCMDDDDLRRGRPTCHKVYGEALAVLAGDALLTHAFALLGRAGAKAGADLVATLAEAAGPAGMVGGQAQDLSLGSSAITREEVDEIHLLKTAALIGAACRMGAIAAGAGQAERAAAEAYGLALGRCFQAVDDILDVTGDAATLGKTPGKDERTQKPTLVAAIGLDGARVEARRLADEARARAIELSPRGSELVVALVETLLERRA